MDQYFGENTGHVVPPQTTEYPLLDATPPILVYIKVYYPVYC